MVNWFVNHEGNHLFMEPGEKAHLLGGHSHEHVHTHGPVEEISPMHSQANQGGFFASTLAAIRQRVGMVNKPPQKLRPASAVESLRPVQGQAHSRPSSMVGSEYEMTGDYERTRKHYQKLSNRRSML